MTTALKEEWIAAIRAWADDEPLIKAAYLFGSRVKGTSHMDSDLDVAVIVAGEDENERMGHAIFDGPRWTAELQSRLSVELHLHCLAEDDIVVMPAVRDHGQ